MKYYTFDLTDEQSIQFESVVYFNKVYSIEYAEDKIGCKIMLNYFNNSGLKSFRYLYKEFNDSNHHEFDYIFSLIKPFIREHKINNLVN